MSIKRSAKWLKEGLEWRAIYYFGQSSVVARLRRMLGFIHARWGFVWRRLHYPIPWMAPYRRKRVVVTRHAGLGDVLMCTPGLRELKRLHPECHVTLYAPYAELVKGLSYIDEVHELGHKRLPDGTIRFWVEDSMPPWRHISELMADHLGVKLSNTRPDCVVDRQCVARFKQAWATHPKPWVLVNRYSSGYTPNKDWFEERWDELINGLITKATVIEIGNKNERHGKLVSPNYFDLRGQTSLSELAAAVAAADLFVSPVSGPVHIAAAVRTPGVVIYGGFEKPIASEYHGNINLTTNIPCSPCFLKTTCPIGKECLRRISVAEVAEAIARLWDQISAKNGSLVAGPQMRV